MSKQEEPPKPPLPLDYPSAPNPDDLEAEKQWERERLTEQRRFARESFLLDLTSNWKMWIVVLVIATVLALCFGRGGLIWQFLK